MVAVVVWSAAIALHGIAGSFPELVGARALLGLAQSFYTPPSYSLLASMFPPAQRARANSVFALGVYLGCSLASLVLLVAPTLGWRAVCFTVGASGLPIAALLCGVVREPGLSSARPASTEGTPLRDGAADSATLLQGQPPAAAMDDAAAPHKSRARAVRDAGSAVCAVLACPRVVLVTLASTFRFAGGIAVASYLPIAFRRAFPDQNAAFGVGNALIIAFAGSASSLAGGAITTVWAQRWAPAESAVPAASALLALGPFYVAAHSEVSLPCLLPPAPPAHRGPVQHFAPAMVSLAAFFLVGEGWLGSALAAVQRHAPAQHRGLATSLLLFLASAVGNASPAVLGRLDDGTPRLRVLLFWTVTATYMAAAALFLAAAALPPPSERPGLRRRPTPSTSSEAAPMLGNPQDAPMRVVAPPQPRPPVGQELRGP